MSTKTPAPPRAAATTRNAGARPRTARVVGARRRRLLVVVIGLLVVGTAAWVATRSPFLDVDHLVVSGNARATADEVLAAAGVAPGDPMVWIDPGAAARKIETLPWVLHAEVKREWPDTVKVVVAERVPVAWLDTGFGNALVLDRDGRALTTEAPAPVGLPQVLDVAAVPIGVTVAQPEGARIAGALAPDQLANVRTIAVAAHRATLVVASGQEVRLGRPTQVGDKMRAAFAVLAREEAAGKAYVDVSAPSTPVAG
ncbi:MAG: FtsQ-type POTRA domain-containing protein [Acidimicrobiia bacterium]